MRGALAEMLVGVWAYEGRSRERAGDFAPGDLAAELAGGRVDGRDVRRAAAADSGAATSRCSLAVYRGTRAPALALRAFWSAAMARVAMHRSRRVAMARWCPFAVAQRRPPGGRLDANANMCSMPSGHGQIPYPRLRAALDAGDLEFVRRYAREQGPVDLGDALRVCLLIRDRDPGQFERAAVRWISRFALEARQATLEDVRAAADALEDLRSDADGAMADLAELCVRHRIAVA